MTRPRGRVLAASAAIAGLLFLAACAAEADEPNVVADDVIDGAAVADEGDAGDSDPSQLVPEECSDAYVLAAAPADIAEIALMPADWPAPPDGAILCMTSETMDGSSETASYASHTGIEGVFDHYSAALSGYEIFRADGAETGTGYATLDGVGAGVAFQIRETDGGFVLVFGSESGL